MNEFNDIWEKLQRSKKPIVIYGMGDGCDKILKIAKEKNINIRGIFASDEYVRSKIIHGFPIRNLRETQDELGDLIALLAFGVFRDDLMQQILDLSQKIELYAPEVPLFGGDLFDYSYVNKHKDEIEAVFSMLADNKSRDVFKHLIHYKLHGDIDSLINCQTDRQDDLLSLIPYQSGDHYVDLGAYDGDTVLEWAKMHPDYGKITALEPNPKTYEKLLKNCSHLSDFTPLPYASWSENATLNFKGKTGRSSSLNVNGEKIVTAVAVDSIADNVDFIKMDVEGAEKETILGCNELIKKNRPSLCISAYHRTEDIFAIPLLVKQICPEYRVYCRHSPYIPAWDTFFYFSCR